MARTLPPTQGWTLGLGLTSRIPITVFRMRPTVAAWMESNGASRSVLAALWGSRRKCEIAHPPDTASSSPFASGEAGHGPVPVTSYPAPHGVYHHGTQHEHPAMAPGGQVHSAASHAYATPHGDHPRSVPTNVKQEIKEEDMDWLSSTSERPVFRAPLTPEYNEDNGHPLSTYGPCGQEADAVPFVKTEPAYDSYSSYQGAGASGGCDYTDDNLGLNEDEYEYVPSDTAIGFAPTPYMAEDGSHVRTQPYAYYASPPQSPDEDPYEQDYYVATPPRPIHNTRSYTLENAMIPVTPVKKSPEPPTPTVPSHRGRPIMDHLPFPGDVTANATQTPASQTVQAVTAPSNVQPASPMSQKASGAQKASSSHGQPIRRGRGRPKKPPLPSRSSPPLPVNYPYPSFDAPVQPPPAPGYDVRPQRRWMDSLTPPESSDAPADAHLQPQVSLDEIPFPEGAEHPGQQMFKLTSPGAAKDPVKKKPIMACLFCRERKIACGPPVAGAAEQRCNQCARRDLVCEYPKESRRGMHKRFPRANKAKEQTEGAEGDAASSESGMDADVQMGEVDAPLLPSPPARLPTADVRRRSGKDRQRSNTVGVARDQRKAAQRKAGTSLMEASAAGTSL
ncbi:uncharacterized protein C8Q71DRAFT_136792 [Rhodofomes roseus]|uniref:Zn(2)-C6 fungal-type domain-containing protein n=1 Tax=Rhodofomes roseus TaxID=34475 RepID=A0ABQ8KBT3_9APHY|nr:uncharacterized protein C8Q71DRAFT_136792 [Rhodofomes roseus]KAH9835012.1 hypothetical protein C8Q71DRAFT_136792 [Rhodofomes roseus]